jgi:predicted MFS family arabinose efflux permease
MAFSFALLNLHIFNPFFIAIASTFVITIAEMIAMPFMNTWYISRSTQNNRGQYAAIYTMAWSGAQVVGSTTGTQAAHAMGFTNLWWLITIVSLLAAVGYYWLYKKEKQ